MFASRGALGRHLRGLLGRLGGLVDILKRIVGRRRPVEGVLGVSRDRLEPRGSLSEGSLGRF